MENPMIQNASLSCWGCAGCIVCGACVTELVNLVSGASILSGTNI